MMESRYNRGFALPVAIFALVIAGVLVTGGFYLARQETRIGSASERGTTAFYMAERGAIEVMAEWDPLTFGSLANWASSTVADSTDDGIWSVNVTRMTDRLYFLLSTGTENRGSAVLGDANRVLGVVARLSSPTIQPRAALSTVGTLIVGGSSIINGEDSIPPMWGSDHCDPALPPKPGILIDTLANVTTEGKKHLKKGDPPALEDNTLTSESLLDFGEDTWNELVAMADKVYSDGQYVRQMHQDSVLVSGKYRCATADDWAFSRFNWGDPYHPGGACGSYFPVIHARGDLIVEAHDYGQGILLVEGNLTFKGGFEFFGPVIVRGTVLTEGTGGHFNGGLIAANVQLNTTTVLGDAVIQYSSCAVERAVLFSALTRVRPLERRSWVDLSSVVGG